MKQLILQLCHKLGFLNVIRILNFYLRKFVAFTHRIQFSVEWGNRRVPDWFDHRIDQYYLWPKTGNPSSWERGIFNLLAMKQGANVLELCCGDGFNTDHFYSVRANKIKAMDIDPMAIAFAKKNSNKNNIEFIVGDIRKDIPVEKFDNIIWDASLEYFTEQEIDLLMKSIKHRMNPDSIFSGFSIIQKECSNIHKYAFTSKEDLLRFLKPYFKNIRILETVYPFRHNLYFYASDESLPFDANWMNQLNYNTNI